MTFNTTFQPQSALPASPQQVDQSTFVQGLPYQVPAVPQLPLSANAAQLVGLSTGYTRKFLQDYSGKNAMRIFLYNWMSQNQFQNQQFSTLVLSVVEYAEYLICTQNQQTEQAIATAADSLCQMMASFTVQQFPELQNYVHPQQMQEVYQNIARAGQIQGAIKNFQMQAQQQFHQQPQYGQQTVAGPGQFRTMQSLHVQAQPFQSTHQNRGHIAALGLPVNSGGMFSTPAAPVTTTQPGSRSGLRPRQARNNGVVESFDASGYQHNTQYSTDHQTYVAPPPVVEAPEPFTGEEHYETDGGVGYSVHTPDPMRPYDEIRLDNGVVVRPASLSGWERTWSVDNPYPELYNPATHVKFHARKEDGTVHDVFMQKKPDMDYLDHEIVNRRQLLQTQLDAELPQMASRWELVEQMKTLPTDITKEANEAAEVDLSTDPLIFPEILTGHSFAQCEILFHAKMADRGMDSLPEQPCEFYFNRVTPVFTGTNHVAKLKELANAPSLTRLVDLLREQHGKTNSSYWNLVNQRLGKHLNEVLEINMSLVGWGVESFVDDYAELCELLVERYSDTLLETLERNSRQIITSSLNVFTGDLLSEYLALLPKLPEVDYKPFYQGTLVLSELSSATYVPWALADFNVNLTDTAGQVKASTMPTFFNALAALVERTKNYRHRFLVTSDRQLVEVHVGYLGVSAESFLVRRVSFD